MNINTKPLIDALIWQLESTKSSSSLSITKIQLLHRLEAKVDYDKYLTGLDSTVTLKHSGLYKSMRLVELKQQLGRPYELDSIKMAMQETLMGSYYWSQYPLDYQPYYYRVTENPILTTLKAYQIMRADSTVDKVTLARIRNFFLEERKATGRWRNTYETAKILAVILPDWLKGGKPKPVKLELSGAINQTVTEFPFEVKLNKEDWEKGGISVSKSGDYPVYLIAYQTFWETKADTAKQDYFAVKTYFGDNSSEDAINELKAGEKIILNARVTVKKRSEYVMVEIPIPAGCSYESKPSARGREVHREYYRHKVSIFCEKLPEGTYTFSVTLIPRYGGTYTLNPATAEQMYFPIFYGNETLKKVAIE